MKFKFQYLKPREDLIRIIEKYEELGYTASFSDIENLTEDAQRQDCTTYIGLMFKRHKEGHFEEALSVSFPKDFFYPTLEYKDWMPREEFEELCAQDDRFCYLDCILVKDLDESVVCADVLEDTRVTHDTSKYALGFFGKFSGWHARYIEGNDLKDYKYVYIIKNAPIK